MVYGAVSSLCIYWVGKGNQKYNSLLFFLETGLSVVKASLELTVLLTLVLDLVNPSV